MDQRTHTWIAIRAIALLDDEGKEENLVRLLRPLARKASVGAWIPDQADAKRGGAGAATENHILKMEPYTGHENWRFTTKKTDLLKSIGTYRDIYHFIESDNYKILDKAWWDKPYKGDVKKPGQHLPNRASSMGTMLKDLLLLGNQKIDSLIPGDIRFAQYMAPEVRTTEAMAAMYFFMLSHFIADVSMPCHCDARQLASYSNGLHKELEGHWSKKIGTKFEKNMLIIDESEFTPQKAYADSVSVLEMAKEIDVEFDLDFTNTIIPDLIKGHDIWLELIQLCRASFAAASIIVPPSVCAYDDPGARAPFNDVLGDTNQQLLRDVDKMALHDAVKNTAIIWKHLWNKVSVDE